MGARMHKRLSILSLENHTMRPDRQQHPHLAKLIRMLENAGCEVIQMPPDRRYFIVSKPIPTVVSLDGGSTLVLQKDNVNLRQSPEDAEKTLRKWQKIHYTS
jgi:hypothetical protein